MLKKSLLGATLLFAIAGPAFAQQAPMPAPQQGGQRPSPFERADANNDGVLTREEVRVSRTASFTRLDANRDGFLVREEMPRPPQGRRDDGANQRQRAPFQQADANSDGTVTRAEFDAASARNRATRDAQMEAWRNQTFARMDTNNDGAITVIETEAARTPKAGQDQPREGRHHGKMGGHPNPHPNPDTNNDQKVSLAEWLARPDPLFDRGDVNKDGRVTREEAAAIVRQGRGEGGRSRRPW